MRHPFNGRDTQPPGRLTPIVQLLSTYTSRNRQETEEFLSEEAASRVRRSDEGYYWGGEPYSPGAAADEPPKRGSISRNRRDETRLRGCWFRGAA